MLKHLYSIIYCHNMWKNIIFFFQSMFDWEKKEQLKDKSDALYFELPYIGNLSHHIENKLSKLCKKSCRENFNIKLVFNSFKIKNYFAYRDPIPNDLKSFLVCKFTSASCSSSYIGETSRYFKTRIQEHITKDNKSHIFITLLGNMLWLI